MNTTTSLPTRDYNGSVNIAGKELSCAVLSDGTRILTSAAIFKAFDRPRKGKSVKDQRVANMPSFLDANNLKPFILAVFQGGPDFEDYKVRYAAKFGTQEYIGYKAEILPMICDVYLQARDEGVLTENQEQLAIASDILMRSLAKVGITALIDEATGYQYDSVSFIIVANYRRYKRCLTICKPIEITLIMIAAIAIQLCSGVCSG